MRNQTATFGRGNLLGRLNGYRRGSMTLNAVTGSVRLARRFGVPEAEILGTLGEYGLAWSADAEQVIVATESGPIGRRKP